MSGLPSLEKRNCERIIFYEILNPKYNLKENYSKFILNKRERPLLKMFLLNQLHKIFCELFINQIKLDDNYFSTEYYSMDSKLIQILIQQIINTNEYTLEGISYQTRIPFDIIFEAACGISNQFSITLCVQIFDLYVQVKPDIAKVLAKRLLDLQNKDSLDPFSLLDNE